MKEVQETGGVFFGEFVIETVLVDRLAEEFGEIAACVGITRRCSTALPPLRTSACIIVEREVLTSTSRGTLIRA